METNETFSVESDGEGTKIIFGERVFITKYSKAVIDALIQRKGVGRLASYLTHTQQRGEFLRPLFAILNHRDPRPQLNVLEVGCSAGFITEYLNEQASVEKITAFDVDRQLVEITHLKAKEIPLLKVAAVSHFSNKESFELPYDDDTFDLVIVLAVVEHLPVEGRHAYVDEYYRVLKPGGLIGFWDTPNRFFPYESHSVGLPFLGVLPAPLAYIYAKAFRRKMRGVSFADFMRPGTGWQGASYCELVPRTLMMEVEDVSSEFGYTPRNRLVNWLAGLLGSPAGFFSSSLNVVFRRGMRYDQ